MQHHLVVVEAWSYDEYIRCPPFNIRLNRLTVLSAFSLIEDLRRDFDILCCVTFMITRASLVSLISMLFFAGERGADLHIP